MTLRVFEAFAGIGTQHMALRNIGADYDVVAIAEVDEYAILSYDAIHTADKPIEEKTHEEMTAYLEKLNIPMTKKGTRKKLSKPKTKALYEASVRSRNLGDVSQIEPTEVPDHDLFTYSFPCFAKGTMILTSEGYKDIIDINIGDLVLTHTGQYKRVVKLFNQGKKEIVKYTGSTGEIVTTKNHKFRVRPKMTTQRGLELGESIWKPIGELTSDDYVGLAINQESKLPPHTEKAVTDNFNNPSFWWLVGRYIADGCINYVTRNGKTTNNGLFISVGYNEDELKLVRKHLSNIEGLGEFSENNIKDTVQFITYNNNLINYLKQFGQYAHNKKLTGDIINLPIDFANSFLEGYESGDGWYNANSGEMSITSTSKELLLGIGQLVMKTKNVPYRLYFNEVPKKKIIEGREVNQRDFWILRYIENPKKKTYSYDGLNIWIKFKGIVEIGEDFVYDIEVEDDHSFTASNLVVKNCQDISVAGKGKGFEKGSGTRSGLLWECEKVIRAKKPKYLLMENVKNLISKKFKPGFEEWLQALEELGYSNYYSVLNAKDYGIPQNRERVFCVSILGEHEPYKFPEKETLELRLKDILEDEVDEKYYLDDDKVSRLTLNWDKVLANKDLQVVGNTSATGYNKHNVYHENGISPTLMARDYKGPNQVLQVGQYDTETRTNSNRFRTYDPEGIGASLTTMGGGGREPHVMLDGQDDQQPSVLIKNGTKRGYLEATDGDGVDLAFPNSTQRRGRVQKDLAQTLDTSDSKGVVVSSSDIRPINPLKGKTNNGWHFEQQVYDKNGITRAVKAGGGSGNIPKTIEVAQTSDTSDSEGAVKEPLGTLAAQNSSAFGPGYIEGLSKTLRANKDDISVLYSNLRIRKLTPKECWRLMGTTDEDFAKAASVNSNSQLYKQAGNAIVVDVLERIFAHIFSVD